MLSMAPNIVFAPNITQNANRGRKTQTLLISALLIFPSTLKVRPVVLPQLNLFGSFAASDSLQPKLYRKQNPTFVKLPGHIRGGVCSAFCLSSALHTSKKLQARTVGGRYMNYVSLLSDLSPRFWWKRFL